MNFLTFVEIFSHSAGKLYIFLCKNLILRNHADVFYQFLEVFEWNQVFLVFESIYDCSDSVLYFTLGADRKAKYKLPEIKPRFLVLVKALEYLFDKVWPGL